MIDLDEYNDRLEADLIREQDEREREATLAAATYRTAVDEANGARRRLNAFYCLYPERMPNNVRS